MTVGPRPAHIIGAKYRNDQDSVGPTRSGSFSFFAFRLRTGQPYGITHRLPLDRKKGVHCRCGSNPTKDYLSKRTSRSTWARDIG